MRDRNICGVVQRSDRVIEWEPTDDGIRVADAVENELSIDVSDWTAVPVSDGLARPTDAEFAIETDRLTTQHSAFRVLEQSSGDPLEQSQFQRGTQLDAGSYLVVGNSPIQTYIQFEGRVRIETAPVEQDTRLRVSFPNRRRVHFGFRSTTGLPVETVTVPETTAGVAKAISVMSAAHRTISPDRTFWTMRRHPPTIEFGDEYDIPAEIEAAIPETGIELHLSDSLRSLFIGAPLAYYLGAAVVIDDESAPRLVAPSAGIDYDLGPDLVESVPSLLSRVFWLDCLARNGGPHAEPDLAEHALLTEIGIEHEDAYAAHPAERLEMYLAAPYSQIVDELPEWPLAMHVDPTIDHVSTLPFLLNHLSYIYPPETTALEGSELMQRSLDDFYRSQPGPIASVEMMKPKLRKGRIHGWLADGTPIDVFKTIPAAYENHLSYQESPTDDEMSVVVVLNDRDMTGEHERVAQIYHERAEHSRMNVRLEYELTCQELADLLEEPHEFLHYIGHCEVDGLRCADGNLSMSELEETNVQTFFLNACGSYYEGLDLVRKGAIAGAVTFRKVLDEQAAKVGTAFAHLLISGFPIETALRLARRRIMMGKDYAVVGNGMQHISKENEPNTFVVYVETLDSGLLDISWAPNVTWELGGYYTVALGTDVSPRLAGNCTESTLTPDEFADFIVGEDVPIILDGEFYWSHEVVDRFRSNGV